MAGTATLTTEDVGGGVTRYKVAWTSTAGGAVSGNAFDVKQGSLLGVKFVPASGGTQPSDLYDVTLIDEDSVDLLDGNGSNLSNSAGAYFQWNPPLWHDAEQQLDLVIANAGASKTGTFYLWVR